MKRNTFIFIALFVGCLSAGAQVKTIRGHVPYYQNCIVEVYNRNIKAKVDAKGFFVLPNITDDDVLVFYNRGKKTNSSNSYAVARINHTVISEIPAPLGEPELTINRDTAGVAFVNENTKSNTIYQDTYHNNYSSSINIGSIRQKRNTDFTINNPNPLVFDVAYTTFVDFATAGRLPEIA
ncbi:MAG: hypothetical protein LBV75_00765, partial [Paludibacter sp.]|nr:hypothetical protein [Paludibacter sp.]